jgi:phage portal protein BeeE
LRSPGALVYANGQSMTAAQFDRLKSELEETYAGARNAGRPMRAAKAASTERQ